MPQSKRTTRRGIGIIWVAVTLPALLGFASLAVDFGRVQTAKTELRRACDAAALYGSYGLTDGTAVARAIQSAGENSVDGTPLRLQSTDISTGSWVSGVFTVNGTPTNAIRIITGRTTARGNAIPLLFAVAVGRPTCDINATTVVYRTLGSSASGYGFFGTASASFTGTTVDSYNSATTSYSSSSAESKASIATNGVATAISSSVGGSFQSGLGKVSVRTGSVSISGSTSSLTTTPTFLTPTLPALYSPIGAISLSGTQTFYLGVAGQTTVYYATGVVLSGSITLNCAGPIVIYNSGVFTSSGTFNVVSSSPSNFTLEQTGTGAVAISGNGSMSAHIVAPASAVAITGTTDYYGTILAGALAVTGSVHLHDDESGGATGVPSVVK